MKIISTNIGVPTEIIWKGKKLTTGIFKEPVLEPIFLGYEDVEKDHVIDRRYHGGNDKACYVFSEIQYEYWKKLYPELNLKWGSFGENLTISELDESQISIGDVFKIGESIVQVSQPRQPCFKLGIRFGTQKAVKQFAEHGYSGIYLRILNKAFVKTGDEVELIEKNENSLTVKEVFNLIYQKNQSDKTQVNKALNIESLAKSCRNDLIKHWNL